MRLLRRKQNNDDFELAIFSTDDVPPYAILSHTWIDGQEVTYDELVTGTGKNKAGYDKIRFCGKRAAQDNLQYFWVDTCCIDKSSYAELSQAIHLMFRRYRDASRCYVYLSDVPYSPPDARCEPGRPWEFAFRRSRWFTRGWTLQELLTQSTVEFFSREGRRLDDKSSLGWKPLSVWKWKPKPDEDDREYVFCHNDLGQHNVLVDTKSLKFKEIVDWGYSGLFPRWFEATFWKQPRSAPTICDEDRLRVWLIDNCEEVKTTWPSTWLVGRFIGRTISEVIMKRMQTNSFTTVLPVCGDDQYTS